MYDQKKYASSSGEMQSPFPMSFYAFIFIFLSFLLLSTLSSQHILIPSLSPSLHIYAYTLTCSHTHTSTCISPWEILSVRKKSDVRGEVGWKEGPRDGGTCSSLVRSQDFIFSAVGHYWNIEARNLIQSQNVSNVAVFSVFHSASCY